MRPESLTVVLGEHNNQISFETKERQFEVEEAHVYPGFSHNLSIDFGLLKLAEEVQFTTYPLIRPICLPEPSDRDHDVGRRGFVSGWGYSSENDSYTNLSPYLKELELEVYTEGHVCQSGGLYGHDSNFCAKPVQVLDDKHCEGDSGGPLFAKEDSENEKNGEKEKPFEQIGIASGEIFRGIDKGCTKNNTMKAMLLFEKYDTVKDGVLTIEELGTNSQDQLYSISLNHIFNNYDTDENGSLDFPEFEELVKKLKRFLFFGRVAYALDWIRNTINNTGKFCPRP